MNRSHPLIPVFLFALITALSACEGGQGSNGPAEKDIVTEPEKIDVYISRDIAKLVEFAAKNHGRINDTVILKADTLLGGIYSFLETKPVWSREGNRLPIADSLIDFIADCKNYGLFPSDYHHKSLQSLRERMRLDSLSRLDAALWSQQDLMLTDALLMVGRHLKQGRLKKDSVTLSADSVLYFDFYKKLVQDVLSRGEVRTVLHELEPRYKGYDSLKHALRFFLDSVGSFKRYTYVIFPNKDSVALYKQLQLRFFEEDYVESPSVEMDTAQWKSLIRRYQKSNGLKETGKPNLNTINRLNNTPWEKFKTIAVNLDRYKQLPDTLPERYLWVNIPSYYLEVREADTMVFKSRIVVGKPETRTPLLTSRITDMITYPQWTIPTSIIEKEVLPGVKKNPNYFAKHGYSIINDKGEEIDPATIDWKRYTKGIPYKVVQGSGDANALGILKFNFSNKYSVYLHDTNQRYLFKNASRSLSHGCVRVQEWEKLAHYLVNKDSMTSTTPMLGTYPPADSLRVWMKRKEKHYLPVRNRMPLYIRYFSAEGVGGRVKLYEDIYGEDKRLKERYFADKSIQ
jgi:L,D-transpeptidase YcbB